ncbi:glycosyltransferase family 2 protein [Flavobacterium macrobrachii]|uniref:Glycosyltransferase family 2 protein n=1 Tax=Flavobacterium macrobrachii TaxID=591204 RepID=A0ABS2CW60_9FLAO|nr:glycosyltransferase family 2 protein [Flavobacterium macrobrachii]MBM6499136.1 glycosyltransferase family 2 protein [Flavobacterium macrobrachii]PZO30925.1 MAG: dTDP-Rha--alpha-D-GlcNAc-pyrophosphate polyprenol alpha-3-L-rhamnosyltransferase [Flavobacteriaceae bacterium]
MKKIAVVILNWNGEKLLKQFLPSVISFSSEAKIYVADNASTDNSLEVIKNQFPSVTIIQNDANYGFAKGYNVALQNIEEKYLCLLNSDVEVTENWLTPILSLFENNPEVGIIQPKILDYKNKAYFEYAGAAGGYIDKFGYPFCRGRIFDNVEKDNGQYDDEQTIFWASGACFFIRKDIFNQLNGFDDDFFAHQEEIDLCWRAINGGYKIKYTSKSVVFHVGGATLNEGNPRKTFLNFRNSLLMLLKNLPKKELFSIIFSRLCMDGLAGIQFVFKGKFKHSFAIIKAHFSFYSLINKTLKKRTSLQLKNYYYTKSIVYQYFVKNGKVFDKI